jgi:DNA-binding NtrC family response regulator
VLPKALIITSRTTPDSALASGCADASQCQWQTWEDLGCDGVTGAGVQLIIAHADPFTEKAMGFLRSFADKPGAPLLAILPCDCGRDVMALASSVAADFLFSPLREDELQLRISRLLGTQTSEMDDVQKRFREELGLGRMVGTHPEFLLAVQQALLFSKSDAPVLITGETGTGKELFAHAIHSLSRRCNGPFIPLDCGTLPEHLAENELFGHRRGAYTDAHADQKGLAAMADGGTLFLDEIDALSSANQAKFLRFLQEGAYRALGSDRITRSNIRIIAATNRPIEEAVRQRQFRNDLYFRINVLRLNLPALRQRRGDISLLARHFLASEFLDRPVMFSPAALRKLENYHWPGNVRELLNAVQRAAVCCSSPQVLPKHIVFGAGPEDHEPAADGPSTLRAAKQAMIESFEKSYVEELLARFQGSVTRAAREAGKERRAFGRLVKKYGISAAPGHNSPARKAGDF